MGPQAGSEEAFDVPSTCAPLPSCTVITDTFTQPGPCLSGSPRTLAVGQPHPITSCSSGYGGLSKKRKQIDQIDNVMALAIDKLASLPSHQGPDPCMDFAKVVYNELKSMNDLQRKLAKKNNKRCSSYGRHGSSDKGS